MLIRLAVCRANDTQALLVTPRPLWVSTRRISRRPMSGLGGDRSSPHFCTATETSAYPDKCRAMFPCALEGLPRFARCCAKAVPRIGLVAPSGTRVGHVAIAPATRCGRTLAQEPVRSRQFRSSYFRSKYEMRLVIKEVNNADCHDPGLLAGNYFGARSLRPHKCCAVLQVREQFGNAVICMMSAQPILPGRRLVGASAVASRSSVVHPHWNLKCREVS